MQVSFGPLRCDGIGLSDGMERLWSYLRRYGRMTKEMRPSHRIDILVHTLVHYGMKTSEILGIPHLIHLNDQGLLIILTCQYVARLRTERLERAQTISIVAEESYANLLADFEGKTSFCHDNHILLAKLSKKTLMMA